MIAVDKKIICRQLSSYSLPMPLLTTISPYAPILTFIAGFGAKWAQDVLQDRRSSRREIEARNAARRDFLQQRSSDFQRQNLLDLQDELMKCIRFGGQMNHHDAMAARAAGKWVNTLLPEDINEGSSASLRKVAMLTVRIRDEGIRKMAPEMTKCFSQMVRCKSELESDQILKRMADAHVACNERIGELLRAIDEVDAPT